jgi:hypothetical protein
LRVTSFSEFAGIEKVLGLILDQRDMLVATSCHTDGTLQSGVPLVSFVVQSSKLDVKLIGNSELLITLIVFVRFCHFHHCISKRRGETDTSMRSGPKAWSSTA